MTELETQPDLRNAMPESHLSTPDELRFRAAVEQLKAVFGKYDKPPVEECVDPQGWPVTDAERTAWARSPWDYRPEDSMEFIWHSLVLFTPPPEGREAKERVIKYWLPRLLYGLGAGESAAVFDDWFIVDQLRYTDWHHWPTEEAEALQTWCEAWLRACVAYEAAENSMQSRPGSRWASDCLSFAISIDLDLTPVLTDVIRNLQPRDVAAIEDVVFEFAPKIIRRELLDDTHDPETPGLRALLRWILASVTCESLEAAFFRAAENDAKLASRISTITEWIENLRKSYAADPRGMPDWLAQTTNKPQ